MIFGNLCFVSKLVAKVRLASRVKLVFSASLVYAPGTQTTDTVPVMQHAHRAIDFQTLTADWKLHFVFYSCSLVCSNTFEHFEHPILWPVSESSVEEHTRCASTIAGNPL